MVVERDDVAMRASDPPPRSDDFDEAAEVPDACIEDDRVADYTVADGANFQRRSTFEVSAHGDGGSLGFAPTGCNAEFTR